MEALCRVAVLKALPTDAEVDAASCRDAGVFLETLRERDSDAYDTLLRERRVAWGEEPRQPPERCVAHLLSLVVRRIEEGAGGVDASSVSRWLPGQIGRAQGRASGIMERKAA